MAILGRYRDPTRAKRGDSTGLLLKSMYLPAQDGQSRMCTASLSLLGDESGTSHMEIVCIACGSAASGTRLEGDWWRYKRMIGL